MVILNKYMDATAELRRNPVRKHQIEPEYVEISRLARDGTTELVSRDHIHSQARTRTEKCSFSLFS